MAAVALGHGISYAAVLKSYIGLLCLGTSDFEAVRGMREDDYFHTAMGIGAVPSTETLRQRLDGHAEAFLGHPASCLPTPHPRRVVVEIFLVWNTPS